jgi:ABC-type glycerol-3-phosphate transport system substrate-binding protein
MRRVLLALLLVACHRAPEGTHITISGSALGKEGEVLRRQLTRFMRANPSIQVEVQETPDDATQRHQLYVQWLNAHVGSPDVLQLDVIWTAEFAAAGWIMPLDRFHPDTRDFYPATIEANRWRGAIYALPWFVDVGMLYWRTDLIPRAPASLDEMNAIATQRRLANGIVWQGARYEGLVTVFSEFLGACGGEIMTRDGRIAVNSNAGVRALTMMRDQIARNIAPRDVLTFHEEECRFAFQNGTSMFMRNWPYAVASLSNAKESRVAGRFAIAPMPATASGRATASLGGSPLAINAWSEHPDAAYKLIAFLTAAEQMNERRTIVGQYPSRMSLFAPRDPVRTIIEAATPRPVTPVYAELSGELQVALHRTLSGEDEPKHALDDAARRMQKILDQSGLGHS